MITLKNLRVIAKAKFSNKSNLGSWYKNRLEICGQCPFNSSIKKDLSLKEKAIVTANLGEPSCLACGCEIAAKASVRDANCGLTNIKQVPLWLALPDIEIVSFNKFHVENLSSDLVSMTLKEKIIIDYGIIERNKDSTIQISIRDKNKLTTDLRASSSCGCTVPSATKSGDTYFLSIKYDTKIRGAINKDVTVRITRNGKPLVFKINLTGTVK